MWDRANILVVDDEAIVCRSCRRILDADAYTVRIAVNGDEALEELRDGDFDVALVDLKIPGSGGLNLVRAIRRESPQTAIVAITGYPSIESAKESIRLGAFDYIMKPFAPQTVLRVVSQALACKPWAMQRRC